MRQGRIGWIAAGVVLAIGSVLTGCMSSGDDAANGSTATASTSTATVHDALIAQFAYTPVELRIDAGDTVEWTNSDEVLHSVTAGSPGEPGDAFDGTLAEAGAQFSFTFDAPGVYSYFCTRHTFMTGTVQVSEAD